MKKYLLFLAVVIIMLFSVACSNGETGEQPGDKNDNEISTLPRSTVYDVEIKTLTDSVTADDGTELIYISSDYPVISNPGKLESVDLINGIYSKGASDYIAAVKNDFLERAQASYAQSPDEYQKYTFVSDVEITYNKNCFLSVKRDYEECYNGFKGNETYAEVYDMTAGAQMYADEIITGSGEDVFKIIFLGFTSVADQFPERFVDGYVDILNNSIQGTEFYLTETGMVFVLQPGIVTLPEYGCLEFELPYEGNEMYFLKLYEQ